MNTSPSIIAPTRLRLYLVVLLQSMFLVVCAVVQRLAGHKILGMTESYLHIWESRLREAATILERVTVEKLQAAMNDERCLIQQAKDRRGAVFGQFVGSWKSDGSL
jgi:hypothetical protein